MNGSATASTDTRTDAGDASPLVRISGVTRRFGSTTALDSVDLDIRHNEFFGLLGPSGCGKTTLLRVLAGFETVDDGTVALDGDDLLGVPAEARPVNLMFQSYALFPHMSVAGNVAYGLECERRPRAEIRQRVGEVLDTVGLTDRSAALPATLSGGQRQRVALARAIVKRPRLLLLDEPLSALDRRVRAEMQSELKRLQHEVGITFVVVTHDQEEALSLSDRVAVMDNGRIQQIDTPAALYRHPRTPFVADFIGDATVLEGAAAGSSWRTGGIAVPLPRDLPAGTVALCLRPENVHLVPTEDPAAMLRGVIADVSFRGDRALVAVTVEGLDVVVLAASHAVDPPHRGDACALRWDPEDAVALMPTHEPEKTELIRTK